MDKDIQKKAIAANLEALETLLYAANVRASEAVAAIKQCEQDWAIGTALGIKEMLEQATALHGAAIAIHRS